MLDPTFPTIHLFHILYLTATVHVCNAHFPFSIYVTNAMYSGSVTF